MTDDHADRPHSFIEADELADECRPAAEGILRCLQMLADEAVALRLAHTLEALHHAIAACAVEAAELADNRNSAIVTERPTSATLH